MGFPRQWRGLPFPSLGCHPYPRVKPRSPASQADSLPSEPPGMLVKSGTFHKDTRQFWQKSELPSSLCNSAGGLPPGTTCGRPVTEAAQTEASLEDSDLGLRYACKTNHHGVETLLQPSFNAFPWQKKNLRLELPLKFTWNIGSAVKPSSFEYELIH